MAIADVELAVQRKTTAWFIKADPFECVLIRKVKVGNGAGGYTIVDVPQAPQTLRMVPLQDSTSERQTPDGRVVRPGYMLVGEHTASIERLDIFVKDGRRCEVVFVVENQQYQVKAEVVYNG